MTRQIFRVLALLIFGIFTHAAFANEVPTNDGDDAKPKYYALLIAIDDYKGKEWAPLKTPVNDANSLSDVLSGKYGFEEVVTIYDEDATRANIIDNIDRLAQRISADDNLLVYFTGHGIKIGEEGYWVPADARTKERSQLIPNSEIKNALSKTVSRHALVMVDACFSGTIFKSSSLFMENDGSADYYKRVDQLASRQAITAGGLEPVPDGTGEHSTFAKYLIKYLKKNKKEEYDAGELYEQLKFPIQANSPNMPQFGHIQNSGHEGGQFIFRLKKGDDNSCAFSGVKMKEGEKIVFSHQGGTLHALVEEYDKNVYYQWIKGAKTLDYKGKDLIVKESGTYSVIVTTDDECQDAAVVEVTVALPDLEVQIQEGSEVTFTNGGTLHAILSNVQDDVVYEWSKSNYIVGQEPNLAVTQAGRYSVVIRLKDGRKIAESETNVTIRDRTYTVRIGDNMGRIARKFYGDASKEDYLYDLNKDVVTKGELLRVGTELKVPLLSAQAAPSQEVTPNTPSSNNRIYIAANENMPPFSQIGLYQNGMLTETVKRVYKEMGQVPVVEFMSGNKMRAQAFSGKSMAGFPAVYNEDEAKLFHYSKPLFEELTVLFVSKYAPVDSKGKPRVIKYQKERDLKGMKIAVVRGFVSEKLLDLRKKKMIGLLAYNTWEECFQKLKAGEVDMVAAPQMVGVLALKDGKQVKLADFKMLPKSLEKTKFHLMISKQNPEAKAMIAAFNKSLAKLEEAGEITKLQNVHIDIFQNDKP